MADAGRVIAGSPPRVWADPVLRLRIAIVLAVLVIWEATAASGLLFTIWQVGPQVYQLRIAGTIVATIAQNLNVTTLPLAIGFRLETLTAAAKTNRIGYFGMTSNPIDGALDDDNFLEA